MLVNRMVEVIENNMRLIIKLGDHTGFSSNFREWISEKTNADIRKIKTKYDRYPDPIFVETVYEVTPISNNAEIVIKIRDDNDYDLGYHITTLKYRFNGQKWECE